MKPYFNLDMSIIKSSAIENKLTTNAIKLHSKGFGFNQQQLKVYTLHNVEACWLEALCCLFCEYV